MPSLRTRLETLADDASWFARATEVRLHLVLVEDDLRETVLGLVARGARANDRTVPYLLFTEPFAGPDAGWSARIRALEDAYDGLREALLARGTTVSLPSSRTPSATTHADFGARLHQLVAATTPALQGAVVQFAPETIEATERYSAELSAMALDPRLSPGIRWVVVLRDRVAVEPLLARLGPSALVSECVPTPEETAAELARIASGAGAAGPASPPLARAGMAWPAQPPPPRKRNGVAVEHPALDPSEAARLTVRSAMLRASIALRERREPDALGALREAHEATLRGNLLDERLTVRLMLGAALAQVGQHDRALQELEATQQDASSAARPMLAAQAASARATLLASRKDLPGALRVYDESIETARKAAEPAKPLLIDLLRLAGQLCLASNQEPRAVAYWREALAVAEALPAGAPAGSAAETARALAALCRQRGLLAQAVSLDAQARRFQATTAPAEAT